MWQVELAQPFSPGGLGRDHRSLCLVIDHSSLMCVAGPLLGQHTSSLVEVPAGGGVGHAIAASVSRPSDRTHRLRRE